ncbi:MAG: aldehyde dehydrogenase [Pegethrix bostrychoides GSE-TBD4-15B]|jgi:acyl-CoA reductase-like NAD-dependent aldehyde dehydrogenase|uniref:Aldehyde dehydrogenase n=1 Tax=Pegethrix bostrychoides GSE-TBD4-15B TaxID=2839662 RepID=A0A951PB91_9CYAN|nr:aldehyde dehydrogenase [Pegethrix bostrychoides GSE-TBD4-15B]
MVQAAPLNQDQDQDQAHVDGQIGKLLRRQRNYFDQGTTQPIEFRLAQLKALKQAILDHQPEILSALKADLHKPELEAYLTEIGVTKEINYAIQRLRHWAKPKSVSLPLEQLPAKGRIYAEPLGVVLIIGPWNYPFQLMISPLIGAIAAGNCALLKPSELAPQTSRVIAQLIRATFDPAYIAVAEGGLEVSQALLAEKFDHIFFTGGTQIGRVVMAAAAQQLTPVTLELGGKSPCIVDSDIQLEYTARRIVWGKFLNAGQTCIAPDYLLVNRQIKPALLAAMQQAIREFYGDDPAQSPDYARIVNDRHFGRLSQLLPGNSAGNSAGKLIAGGTTDAAQRYMAPTILDQVTPEAAVMQDEIFGPILPVLDYGDISEAIALIKSRPKPLALYLFTRNAKLQARVLSQTSSGGVCINDTIMQIAASSLPFGGVGESGMGRYHGKASFDTFSHYKSVLVKNFWLDIKWRYAPYAGKLELFKKIIG